MIGASFLRHAKACGALLAFAVGLIIAAAPPAQAQSGGVSGLGLAPGAPPIDRPYAILLMTQSADADRNIAVCKAFDRYVGGGGGQDFPVYWLGSGPFAPAECSLIKDPLGPDFKGFYAFKQSNHYVNQLQLDGVGPFLVVTQRGRPDGCLRNLGYVDLTKTPTTELEQAFNLFDRYTLARSRSRWLEGADIHNPTVTDGPIWMGRLMFHAYKSMFNLGCRPT